MSVDLTNHLVVDIEFLSRPAISIVAPNGSAVEVVEYLSRILGTVIPNTEIRLDLDPRSFHLRGTGHIELWDHRRIANIRMRRAVDNHLQVA